MALLIAGKVRFESAVFTLEPSRAHLRRIGAARLTFSNDSWIWDYPRCICYPMYFLTRPRFCIRIYESAWAEYFGVSANCWHWGWSLPIGEKQFRPRLEYSAHLLARWKMSVIVSTVWITAWLAFAENADNPSSMLYASEISAIRREAKGNPSQRKYDIGLVET